MIYNCGVAANKKPLRLEAGLVAGLVGLLANTYGSCKYVAVEAILALAQNGV